MPTIKIDEKDYELDTLSEETKAQLVMLQFVDAELQRLACTRQGPVSHQLILMQFHPGLHQLHLPAW